MAPLDRLGNRLRRLARQLYRWLAFDRDVQFRYSQFGEDSVLVYLFPKRRDGFYVDIGAFHPARISNTAYLYQRGWRGINVDLSEQTIALFNHHRKRDINLCCAVSDQSGSAQLFTFEGGLSPLNSLVPEQAAHNRQIRASQSAGTVVPTVGINDLLAQHLPKDTQIDFLTIDAEGVDERIIMALDFASYAPEVIAIEIHGVDFDRLQDNKIYAFLRSKGYSLVSFLWATAVFKRQPRERG